MVQSNVQACFKVALQCPFKINEILIRLIWGWRLLTFLFQMRRLFEGGGYSGAGLIRVNTVCVNMKSRDCVVGIFRPMSDICRMQIAD